jgi:hypothetical protein
VADVVALGVNAQEPFHSGDEIGLRSLEMKMVAYQAPGMDLPFGLGAGFTESAREALAIVIVFEDVAVLVATIDDVVNGAGLFHAQLAWHGQEHALKRELCH